MGSFEAVQAARSFGDTKPYVGDRGLLLAGFNGDHPRVYPESKTYQPAPRQSGEEDRDPIIDQWIGACKGGPASLSNFELQSPVTEAFLLGCLSQRFAGERLEWDSASQRVASSAEANRYIDPPYRSGYRE